MDHERLKAQAPYTNAPNNRVGESPTNLPDRTVCGSCSHLQFSLKLTWAVNIHIGQSSDRYCQRCTFSLILSFAILANSQRLQERLLLLEALPFRWKHLAADFSASRSSPHASTLDSPATEPHPQRQGQVD